MEDPCHSPVSIKIYSVPSCTRDIGRHSDAGSVVVTVASARGRARSTFCPRNPAPRLTATSPARPALTPRLALVLDGTGSPCPALVLNITCTPALAPCCLLLRSIGSLALPIAGPSALSRALAVAAVPGECARRRHEPRVRLGLLHFGLLVRWYLLVFLKVYHDAAAKMREEELVLLLRRR